MLIQWVFSKLLNISPWEWPKVPTIPAQRPFWCYYFIKNKKLGAGTFLNHVDSVIQSYGKFIPNNGLKSFPYLSKGHSDVTLFSVSWGHLLEYCWFSESFPSYSKFLRPWWPTNQRTDRPSLACIEWLIMTKKLEVCWYEQYIAFCIRGKRSLFYFILMVKNVVNRK